jgi:hypothetical protein
MKKIFVSFLMLLSIIGVVRSQSLYQPYSYQFYQKLNQDIYSPQSSLHSALKPYFIDDSLLKQPYSRIMNFGADSASHKWNFFNNHLIDVNRPNATFYVDLLPDFSIGQEFNAKQNVSTTSLGVQLGGTIGKKFSYNISGYLNSAIFPEYLSTYINQVGIVPGQAYAKNYQPNGYDWQYLTAVVSYSPSKYLNITAGRDKTFIGDGYRSEFLSDFASPYPFFKLTASLGHVKYMAMWAYFNNPYDTNSGGNNPHKWGVFHYLDWNVSNRVSFGLFDSIIWYNVDSETGAARGFDLTYLNPVIFLRTVEASNGSPDNALLGFTGKYKISSGVTLYGQFALDEFQARYFFTNNGSSRNKYGWQLGLRGANLFTVKGLNYLVEYNTAKPYTYSEHSISENYSENNEPLAHPWGANFREFVQLLNYSYKRFDFSQETDVGRYGFDIKGLNYGKDIFQLYNYAARNLGNYTGQGLTTNLVYEEVKVAYLLNPRYNLRLEFGGIYRTEVNSKFNDKTTMLTFGVRSSFRSLYTDLSSYKAH